jgi:hypothetical protein
MISHNTVGFLKFSAGFKKGALVDKLTASSGALSVIDSECLPVSIWNAGIPSIAITIPVIIF